MDKYIIDYGGILGEFMVVYLCYPSLYLSSSVFSISQVSFTSHLLCYSTTLWLISSLLVTLLL